MNKKILFDIRSNRSFSDFKYLIDLNQNQKIYYLSLTKISKILVVLFSFIIFVLGSVNAPTISILAANSNSQEERAQLESQLQELERQMAEYENQIAIYQKQGKSLKNEIDTLNVKIAKINLEIKAINLKISQLNDKINQTQIQINITENTINKHQLALIELLKKLYTNDNKSILEIILKHPQLSDFFNNINNIVVLQDNLRITINQIKDLKNELEEQKIQYTLAKADTETLKNYQLAQKNQTDILKQQKNNLLTVTKGQESKYKTLLQKTKEEAAKIRNRLFELLGGGEMTFEQAYQYAKIASQATGVRPAFILAILDRESALGRNVGRCNYQSAMNPKEQPIFLKIVSELGLNPNTLTVSCPNADGPYGGAMGPAQFIPSTWNAYKKQISQITGNNPPSPWNNSDAFTAAALYLKDAGALINERQAAAKYYCGSRWNRYVCTNVYAKKVLEKADQFEDDIQTITNY
ncbi:MAG: lytic murein transglycosylase [bacterium]|nr:lytic murein transglycosylase [bacterium]